MAYAAQADMLTRISGRDLARLTNDAPNASDPNAGVVQAALDEGSAQVDSYCRVRYKVPLQACFDATRMTVDIALYRLYTRRPMETPENVLQSYKDTLAMLRDISTGKASLDQPAGQPTPQMSLGGAAIPRNNEGAFNDRYLEGYCK